MTIVKIFYKILFLFILLFTFFASSVKITNAAQTQGLCQPCGPLDGDCILSQGLSCSPSGPFCVPVLPNRQLDQPCFNNLDCDPDKNLKCDSYTDPYVWCTGNPSADTLPPGRCQPNTSPIPPVIFNCGNPGGQCNGALFDSANCTNGVLATQCQNITNCWINPTDPLGLPSPGILGSCAKSGVANTDCNIGGACCVNAANEFYCKQGTPDIAANPCVCRDNRRPLGGPCNSNVECFTNSCVGHICGLGNACQRSSLNNPVCSIVGGQICIANGLGDLQNIFCCPNPLACIAVGGEVNKPYLCGAGVYTALGCVPLQDINTFVIFVLQRGLSLAGGLTFLMMIFGGIKMIASKGDEEAFVGARNLVSSAVAGLTLIIFAVFILRLFGFNLFGIF